MQTVTEALEDFLAGDRSGRLVLDVEYDRFERRSGASGLRRRHAHSYAIAAVAVSSRADGSELRVAVSGVGPTAVRSRAVEASRDAASVLTDVALGLLTRVSPQLNAFSLGFPIKILDAKKVESE